MISGPSLKRRLSLAILVVLTLLGVAIAMGANLLFDRLEARVSEARVSAAAERLVGAIREGPRGPYSLDPSRLDPEFNRPLSGLYFVVSVGEQRWRSRSLWDSELPEGSHERPGAFIRADGPGGQQLLLLTRVFERFGERFTITVASDYGPLVAEFRRGLYLFIGLWGLALAASLLALNLWLSRALAPVALARRQVAEVRAGERESLAGEFPRELAPLIAQINTLLEETRSALVRSRNALELRVERAELLEVLGNVLDNAWKWARSRIAVTIDGDGARWYLRVEDDGPGIPDNGARQRALGRGQRLDESVAGQGLGLAIAADIIAAQRGNLTLDTSPLGGLAVCIQLPVGGPESG